MQLGARAHQQHGLRLGQAEFPVSILAAYVPQALYTEQANHAPETDDPAGMHLVLKWFKNMLGRCGESLFESMCVTCEGIGLLVAVRKLNFNTS